MSVSPFEAYPAHDRPAADDISRPQDRCDVLHQNFTTQAQLTPDAIAIVASDGQLTYRQLEESSNQLARLLRARGIQRNALVGIALERSLDMAIAILGIAKAGGAYLPLDPAYPIDRLAYMVNDSGLSIVLTHERFVMRLPQDSSLLLLMDRDRSEAAKFSNEALEDRNTPQDIAYCIYTSGSTGLPKGTLISHGAICNMLWWFADYLHLTPNDRIISIAAFSFDASVQEFWPALFVGGCSVLSDPAATRDPEILYRELTNHRITMMTIVPSLLTVLLENPDVVALSHLRHVFSAGEALPGSLRDRFYQYCDAQLHNAYGPTETAICATCGPCRRDDTSPNVGIGKPIRNVSVYVLDDKLTPLSPGIAGELYIGGAGVAIAYLGRPDLTAERFPPNPFGPPGTKLYRTGDLARWRDDGTIEYLGRADRQVKINGIRIEIGEIEAALNALEPVSASAVAIHRRVRDQLVAFVVADADRLQNTLGNSGTAAAPATSDWASLFDEVYDKFPAAPSFDGWNDRYTGAAIPLDAMEEWRQVTVDRIMACMPKRVLEIGCGSGLFLEKIAPQVEAYRATDISPTGIAKLSAWLEQKQEFSNVSLSAQEATDFHNIDEAAYDIVVINSVVQYFPNIAYLSAVLDGAKKVLCPGGRIFVGDVRSATLLALFHSSVQEMRAAPTMRLDQLDARVVQAIAQEDELAVDPEFFRQLVANGDFGIGDMQLKEASFDNELSRYRYDVILSVDKTTANITTETAAWKTNDLASLDRVLSVQHPAHLHITAIPNRRLAQDAAKRDWMAANPSATIAEMRAALASANVVGEDPNAFWYLARAHGYEAMVSWSSEGPMGSFDAEFQNRKAEIGSRSVFSVAPSPVGKPDVDWEKFGNNPALARLKRQLPSWLRDCLERTLPSHMLPARILVLDGMPLTTSGKLDYEALAQTKWEETEFVPAETNIERSLADIWQKVLGIQPIGITARWFDLGGDSILGLQAIARARSNGINLSVSDLFQHPTIADLAAILSTRAPQSAQSLSIPRVSREGVLPVSFGQAGIAFVSHLRPEGRTLNCCNAIKLHGSLDVRALEAAFFALVKRHEILRTTFALDSSGTDSQIIHDAQPQQIATERWERGDSISNNDIYEIAGSEAQLAFDLSKRPLFRLKLLQISPKENILFVSFHHIIFDGWSFDILLDEIARFYSCLIRREQPSLPNLPIQFADYAAWERRQLTPELAATQMAYWKKKLAGDFPASILPLRDRSGAGKRKFGVHPFMLGIERTHVLREFARACGATTSMVLLAAFKTFLYRLTNQEDLWVGVPTSIRTTEEIEKLVGFFINVQILRTRPTGKTSFSVYLDQIKQTVLEAQGARDLPFNQIVQALQPGRDIVRSPLVEIMYNYRKGERLKRNWVNNILDIEILDWMFGEATNDFNAELEESSDDISGIFQYAENVYSRDTISLWAESWLSLLDDALARPAVALDQLCLQTEGQRSRILEWGTGADRPVPPVCLHALIEGQVSRTPDAAAVIFEGQQLSYGELNRRANRLAHFLRGAGVGPDTVVAICAERSLEMVVGLLGILKAGGAYLPIDPDYPDERIAYMLQDANPPVLLTQARLVAKLPPSRARVFTLDRDWASLADQPNSNLDPQALGLTPRHLAYVIYTSGSTGQPKGAMNEHRGIVNRLQWMQDEYRLGAGDRVLQKTPFSFDVSVWEFFWPLMVGACLVEARPQGHQDPDYLKQLMQETGITVAHFVPSMLQAFLEQGDLVRCQGLRHIVCSGEELPLSLQNRCLERLPQTQLNNLYGPTEAAVDVTYWQCRLDSDLNRVPIGRPIANIQIYILDAQLQPVPLGVSGEIYIGGIGVARGYLNRRELTAERFVRSPFSDDPDARLYKTGDLGRWRPDGAIEYLGRNDFQVKIRGFRIELGEIEAQLLSYDGVREAVVTARETPHGKQLVGYVTGNDDGTLEDGLRAHLKAGLPDYMVPSRIVVLERLPLSPNGKLDRKALPEPETVAFGSREYEAPQGEIERALADIWREILKIERVGRYDNFFELGGHSLLAVTLIERMRQRKLHTQVRAVFIAPTLMQLASTVHQSRDELTVPPNLILPDACEITPEMLPLVRLRQEEIERIVATVSGGVSNIQDIYPLAPLQEGILFHHLMNKQHDPYRLALFQAFDSRERLDGYLSALQAVINRHDILRTAVVWEGLKEPVQVVWHQAPLPIEELTLEPTEGVAVDVIEQLRRHIGTYQFDLRRAPLMQMIVARNAENGQWLLAHLSHHIIIEHTTLEILLEEVQAHLLSEQERLPKPLPFRNFVVQARSGVSAAEHEVFFKQMLSAVTEPTAPFGLLDVQGDGSETREARMPVDRALARRIRERARANNVSVASLCHLAYAKMLSRISGQEQVVFGTLLFGRMQGGEGVDRTLGMFINTLPICIPVTECGAGESLRRAHERLADLLMHEHASLALAQRCSAVIPPTPLFTALLNYRHGASLLDVHSKRGWQGIEVLYEEERTNYPFVVNVDDFGEEFELTAQVDARIDAGRVCAYMHTALGHLVEALERAPQTPMHAIEVLPESERQQLLVTWNNTAAEYPQAKFLHALIEGQVSRTPDAAAVIFEGQQLSYGELNRRANRLAHFLRGAGVGPDTVVAICAERSLEMVVGLLGILKAGGAYLPIDPDYPDERIAYMLQDANPPVLLTQARLVAKLPPSRARVFTLDRDWASLADQPNSNLDPQALGLTPRHLAYVIYTSGSTGQPKGAMNEHRGIVNRLQWMQDEYRLGAGDRVLQKTPFSFDVSVWEFFWPLMVGACLVEARPQGHQDPDYLKQLMQETGITVAHFVPSMLQAFLEQGDLVRCQGLRHIVCSGEELPLSLQNRCLERLPQTQLNNLYGPTEAAVDVTYWQCRLDSDLNRVPIGRPIANIQIYILDAQLQPVPLGVSGEIYIGGIGVARGYLNRRELTAERFVRSPFSDDPDARLYKTGDLGRWRPDGAIEYLGRNDFQVKIRGFRIELGEIEAQLLSYDGVREAVVTARETPHGKQLVGYVTGNDDGTLEDGLRAHLKAGLPDYMVPSRIVVLERLPLSPNGKLDRKALPEPGWSKRQEGQEGYVPPRTERERQLVAIWQEVLGIPQVGITDDFFALGGHSLLALMAVSRIQLQLNGNISVREIFNYTNIEQLGRHLEEKARNDLAAPTIKEFDTLLSDLEER